MASETSKNMVHVVTPPSLEHFLPAPLLTCGMRCSSASPVSVPTASDTRNCSTAVKSRGRSRCSSGMMPTQRKPATLMMSTAVAPNTHSVTYTNKFIVVYAHVLYIDISDRLV